MAGIALFGGTFNPIHNGHIQMLNAVSRLTYIDDIFVIPDNIPPHKKTDFLAENTDRVNMCRLAVRQINKVHIDEREIKRGGKSYTFDTVCEFKREYPDKDIYFVCGADMAVSLDTWYNAEELYKLVTFIAFKRVETDAEKFNTKTAELINEGAKIIFMDENIISVSSSELRNNIKKREFNSELLPESVIEYIKINKVYG